MTQVAENIFSKGFCENFFNLFDGINWVHDDCSIPNKTSKVMILDYNMIFPWSKLCAIRNSGIALIIFPYSKNKYWISCQYSK